MRHITLIAVLLVASRSAAQPVAPPEITGQGTCEVTIVRAPDDVRREIESWVAREPFCRVALDVRVIPTEGGLYLLARDSTGLLHERLVPDAQAAGVLISSWVADDALEPPPLPPPTLVHVMPPSEPEVPPAPLLVRTIAPRPPSEPMRWALGLTVLPGDVSGPRVRATLDMLHQDGLAAELILAGAYSSYEQFGMAYRRVDSRALFGMSYTAGGGLWRVRLRGAVGGVWSHTFHSFVTPAQNWFAIPFETSITLMYHMSDAWSVGLAPVVTYYQRTSLDTSDASLGASELGVLLELRHGS